LKESTIIFKMFKATRHSVHMDLKHGRLDGVIRECRFVAYIFYSFHGVEVLGKEAFDCRGLMRGELGLNNPVWTYMRPSPECFAIV
jgi:hypothetical protein